MLNKVKFQEEGQRPQRGTSSLLGWSSSRFWHLPPAKPWQGGQQAKTTAVMVVVAGRVRDLHTLAGSHEAWLDGKGWQQSWQSRQEVFSGDLLLAALGRK